MTSGGVGGENGHILVTGGMGFIGSEFVHLLVEKGHTPVVLDKLTYAANPRNLEDLKGQYRFIKGDVCNRETVRQALENTDVAVHFAAETHVDRAIAGGMAFIKTDVEGTYVMLDEARKKGADRFVYISTDEVYGSVSGGSARESDPPRPGNTYSAAKAGGEALVMAYANTYGMDTLITRSSNNFGPRQHPEKFVPKIILNTLTGVPIPVYGKGENIRDWIYVRDNCEAIYELISRAKGGKIFNIGAGNEVRNLDLCKTVLELMEVPEPGSRIEFVEDRKGHDLRYSMDTSKAREMGWEPRTDLVTGLKKTIDWHRRNMAWWD